MTTANARASSLRKRLLMLLLSALLCGGVILAVVTYFDTHRALDRLLDAHLAQSAQLLTRQAGHELLELEPLPDAKLGSYAQQFAIQIWTRDGELTISAGGAPSQRLSMTERGFSDSLIDGRQWRVYSDWDVDHQALIQVAELHDTRNRLAMKVSLNTVWPLLLVLPIIGAASWWLIGVALLPLARIGAEIAGRDARNLEPLTDANTPGTVIPGEIRPLVDRLNSLFARIATSLEGERRFTADAAHELRNPIAAIRAQAEAALTSTDASSHRSALLQVVDVSQRLSVIVDQLLMLARLDAQTTTPQLQQMELVSLVRTTLADVAPALVNRGIELEFDAPDSLLVNGDAALLQVVVRNLVDNAAKHAGKAPKIRVGVGAVDDVVTLSVADNGPGISEADRQQLGRRFYRGVTAQGAGSGLGLSIVARIAQLHGGTLQIGSVEKKTGAVVSMQWPVSADSKYL